MNLYRILCALGTASAKALRASAIAFVAIVGLTACDVHEFPNPPAESDVCIRLTYDPDFTYWNHSCRNNEVSEVGLGDTYDNTLTVGKIRYIVRSYPMGKARSNDTRSNDNYTREYIFTKDVAEGYDHEVTISLPDGDYDIIVWSDFVETSATTPYYNASDFGEIEIQGDHAANTDYRDGFRGVNSISLRASTIEHAPDTVDIEMYRPLAKFEFITEDVVEFIRKEIARTSSRSIDTDAYDDADPASRVNVEDYSVVFYFYGYMPDTYSSFTNTVVSSSTGVYFKSPITKLTNSTASLGYDYIFVNGDESTVYLQLAILDADDEELSKTEIVAVPIRRSHHTILQGSFLMQNAAGGVSINSEYDGEFNLVF